MTDDEEKIIVTVASNVINREVVTVVCTIMWGILHTGITDEDQLLRLYAPLLSIIDKKLSDFFRVVNGEVKGIEHEKWEKNPFGSSCVIKNCDQFVTNLCV